MRLRKLATALATVALCAVGVAVAPPAFAAGSDPVDIPDPVLRKIINQTLSLQNNQTLPDDGVITQEMMEGLRTLSACTFTDKSKYPHAIDPQGDYYINSYLPISLDDNAECATNFEGLQHATNLSRLFLLDGLRAYGDLPEEVLFGTKLILGAENKPISALPSGPIPTSSTGKGLNIFFVLGSHPIDFAGYGDLDLSKNFFDFHFVEDGEHDFSTFKDKDWHQTDLSHLSISFGGTVTKAPKTLSNLNTVRGLLLVSLVQVDFSNVASFPEVENIFFGNDSRALFPDRIDYKFTNLPMMPKVTNLEIMMYGVSGRGWYPTADYRSLNFDSFPNLKNLKAQSAHLDLRSLVNHPKIESISVNDTTAEIISLPLHRSYETPVVIFNQDIFVRMKSDTRISIEGKAFGNADQCNLFDFQTMSKKQQNNVRDVEFGLRGIPGDKYGVFPAPRALDIDGSEMEYQGFSKAGYFGSAKPEKAGFWRVTYYDSADTDENKVLYPFFTTTTRERFFAGPYFGSIQVSVPEPNEIPSDRSVEGTTIGYTPDYVGTPLPADYVFPERNTDLSECKAIGAMVDDPVMADGQGNVASSFSLVSSGDKLANSTDGTNGDTQQVRLELKNVYGETVKHGAYYLWDRASGADKNRLDYLTLRLKPGDPANEGFVSEGEGQNIWIEPLSLDTDGSRSSNLDKPAVYTAKVRSSKAGSPVLEAVYNDNVFTLAPTAVVPFGNPPTPVNPDPGTGGDSGNTPGTGGDDTGTTPGAGDNPGTGDTPGSNPDAGGAATGSGDASSTGGVAAPKAPTGAGLATTGFDGVRLLLVSSMLIVLGGVTLYRRRV